MGFFVNDLYWAFQHLSLFSPFLVLFYSFFSSHMFFFSQQQNNHRNTIWTTIYDFIHTPAYSTTTILSTNPLLDPFEMKMTPRTTILPSSWPRHGLLPAHIRHFQTFHTQVKVRSAHSSAHLIHLHTTLSENQKSWPHRKKGSRRHNFFRLSRDSHVLHFHSNEHMFRLWPVVEGSTLHYLVVLLEVIATMSTPWQQVQAHHHTKTTSHRTFSTYAVESHRNVGESAHHFAPIIHLHIVLSENRWKKKTEKFLSPADPRVFNIYIKVFSNPTNFFTIRIFATNQ